MAENTVVVFTDQNSLSTFDTIEIGSNVKIIVKELSEIDGYRNRDYWKCNQDKNILLKNICWELNMLWSEKIAFVVEARKYFDTPWFAWCDIGYFRNRPIDTPLTDLKKWPNTNKIDELDCSKIHYACVSTQYLNSIAEILSKRDHTGLPYSDIPADQVSVAGGGHHLLINFGIEVDNFKGIPLGLFK
jgi:hypothetical protein